jgi:hypothetical protein
MMESFDVSLFEVGFQAIVDTLAQYGVDFAWQEKERDKAMTAWRRWQKLSDEDYSEIASALILDIKPALISELQGALNVPKIKRRIA